MRAKIGRWVMVQWSEGITSGILVDTDKVYSPLEKSLDSIDSSSQIVKVGDYMSFEPKALGFKPLK